MSWEKQDFKSAGIAPVARLEIGSGTDKIVICPEQIVQPRLIDSICRGELAGGGCIGVSFTCSVNPYAAVQYPETGILTEQALIKALMTQKTVLNNDYPVKCTLSFQYYYKRGTADEESYTESFMSNMYLYDARISDFSRVELEIRDAFSSVLQTEYDAAYFKEDFEATYSAADRTYPNLLAYTADWAGVSLTIVEDVIPNFAVSALPTDPFTASQMIYWVCELFGCYARCGADGSIQVKILPLQYPYYFDPYAVRHNAYYNIYSDSAEITQYTLPMLEDLTQLAINDEALVQQGKKVYRISSGNPFVIGNLFAIKTYLTQKILNNTVGNGQYSVVADFGYRAGDSFLIGYVPYINTDGDLVENASFNAVAAQLEWTGGGLMRLTAASLGGEG